MISVERETDFTNAIRVLNAIPEFSEGFTADYLLERLNDSGIILIAFDDNKPVACKIAYDRYSDGSIYSWLGGVLPAYRNKRIALDLHNELEKIARESNYKSIVFKTRNKHKSMLHFGLKQGFDIIDFEAKPESSENRILLKKEL